MVEIRIGDAVHMKKPHPCGGFDWVVLRTGAEVHLRCLGCGRQMVLSHSALNKRIRRVVAATPPPGDPPPTSCL